MPTYTLINPHDPYTFDAPDDDIAETVVALLGGSYGWQLEDVDPPRTGGMFNLLDPPAQATATEAIHRAMTRKPELAAALRTVAILERDRAEMDVDPDTWHQRHRTSTVDLREVAQARATSCEFAASNEDVEPVMPPVDEVDTPGPVDSIGWAISIICNVDSPAADWPNQTDEWRTAARAWLDSVNDDGTIGSPPG